MRIQLEDLSPTIATEQRSSLLIVDHLYRDNLNIAQALAPVIIYYDNNERRCNSIGGVFEEPAGPLMSWWYHKRAPQIALVRPGASDLTCAIIGRISAFIRSIHKALLATPWLFPLSIEEPSTLLLPLGNDNEKRTPLRTSIIRIAPQKEGKYIKWILRGSGRELFLFR